MSRNLLLTDDNLDKLVESKMYNPVYVPLVEKVIN